MSILGAAVAAMSKPSPTQGEGSLRPASFGPHLIDWVQWTLLTRPWCGGLLFEIIWGGRRSELESGLERAAQRQAAGDELGRDRREGAQCAVPLFSDAVLLGGPSRCALRAHSRRGTDQRHPRRGAGGRKDRLLPALARPRPHPVVSSDH